MAVTGNIRLELTDGAPLRPMQSAQAIDDFPVPLGPKIMLRFGPGRNSTKSYVTKFSSCTRTIEPGT